ncbi:MAG: aminoacyl-tRNA hydrolase [Gammaproteobacteria bacterium]|nr:aminoacyl-tRNA hydrolase [Gammaproteobacteria bacterium]
MKSATANLTLVVGLGNPGDKYNQTRHNAGFWYIDQLAGRLGARFSYEKRFQAHLAAVLVDGRKLRLMKPGTYMNHSGRALAAVAHYYDVPAGEILIAHDELDLPPGTVRLKRGGGHGGHNGLRDVIAALGEREFWRLRIGIGHPGQRDDVIDYVLHRASVVEQQAIDEALQKGLAETEPLLAGELERVMHVLHSSNASAGPGPAPKTEAPDGV